MKPRILLVDDHRILREGVRSFIEQAGRHEVVGEASDGIEALRLAASLRPDVILMDIAMPAMNGLEALRQLGSASASPRVIVLSVHSEREYVAEALRAGAWGYLSKDTAYEDLFEALDTVLAGRLYLGSTVREAPHVQAAGVPGRRRWR